MICPRCGFVDKDISIPEISRTPMKLGDCKKCNFVVMANPTTKRKEQNPTETVKHGESREESILLPVYLQYNKGLSSRRRPDADDIDRDILRNTDGKIDHYLEIKERSNSLNAYRFTQFPYAKIDSAERLTREYQLPVIFILKFTDCWARHVYDPSIKYEKGSRPFAPRYRTSQYNKWRQVPVRINVETLEILPWRDLCEG